MLDLLQERNSQLDPNEHIIHLKESEICEQVLDKRFSYVDQHKNPKKTRLENCSTCVENDALDNEVQDLRSQLKSVQTFLNRIPEEFFLQPILLNVSPSNGLNGDY
ncbi:Uncharacterized protein Adt_22785 [Abeliophyllum distichum]|uniref:Uncharacterized protein n=1 Tax=Abeliophyllum distichum TaxID=126358 RepID=A0ABD1S9C8_9LAMI